MKLQMISKQVPRGTIVIIVGAALVVGAFTTYYLFRSQPTANNQPVTTKQNTNNAIAATGYLEPQGELIKISAPAFKEGTRIQQLLVKQADRVKAGQIIAILDNRDRLQAALKQAQTQVKVSSARLQQVKAGAKQADIKVEDAKYERTQAELKGQILTQRATIASLKARLQGEKAAQEAAIEQVKAELQNSQTNCRRYQSLYKQGAVSAQDSDRNCLQYVTTQKRLKEAQANLIRIVTTYQEQIDEAQANMDRTIATGKKQIQEAQASLESVRQIRPVDIQLAQTELEAAQATVQQTQADLDLAYLRSPRDGQILKIHTWPGETISDEGIFELGKTDQMYVKAEVYETDINRVRVGQQATIKADGVIENLQGKVDEIGLKIGTKNALGTDPVADADARVVEVKIRLNPEASQRVANLTNLQVNVLINTGSNKYNT